MLIIAWNSTIQAFAYLPDATNNTFSRSTQQQIDGKGFFGKDTTKQSVHQMMKDVSADFGATPTEIILKEHGTVDISAGMNVDHITVDTKGGIIYVRLPKQFESLSQSKKNEGAFWQTQSMSQESHHTAMASRIGTLEVVSTPDAPVEINIEAVRGQTAEFLKHLNANGGNITTSFWAEVHEHTHKRGGGPTAATAALAAIGISALTLGTGTAASVGTMMTGATGLAGTACAGAATTMFSAGFTSLCVSAGHSLLNNEGDPRRAAKAFASVDTLQSVGISMLAAGLTYGALNGLNQIDGVAIPTEVTEVVDIADHAVHQGVAAGVHTVMDLGIHGKANVVAAGLGAVAGTIGGYLSTKIGQWYTNTPNTFEACVAHKAAHFFNGAGQGLIMGLDGNDSEALGKMVAGAVGAVAAEIYADWSMPTGGSALPGHKGSGLSQTDHATKVRQTRAAAQFVAGSIAYGMKMNAEQIGVAVVTANVALDHNFAPSALRAAGYLGADGTEPEDAEVAGISKSGDEEAVAGGHLGFGDNEPASGRMSPTSKGMYQNIEAAQKEIEQAHAAGQKPSFLQNLALLEAQGTFDERQHNKYLNQSSAELIYKTPGVIKAAPGFIKDTAIGAYDFARDNPGQAVWMAGEYVPVVGGFMTGGRNAKEWHAGDTEWYWAAGETALGFSGFIGKGGKAAVGVIKNSVKVGKGGLTLAKTGERTVHALDLAKHAPKFSTPGGVIRADAIPTGSQLEYLAPGRV